MSSSITTPPLAYNPYLHEQQNIEQNQIPERVFELRNSKESSNKI